MRYLLAAAALVGAAAFGVTPASATPLVCVRVHLDPQGVDRTECAGPEVSDAGLVDCAYLSHSYPYEPPAESAGEMYGVYVCPGIV